MNPKKRLGEMLMEAGVIGETQLKAALGHQRQWGVRLGRALVDLKLATEADIVRALSVKFGFEVARLEGLEPYALQQALRLVPREFALRHGVFPMAVDTASVTVAMSDPSNLAVVDELRFRSGRRVKVCIGGDQEISEALRRHYPPADGVEAIALDLDLEAHEGDAFQVAFGGGSTDDLEAFFAQAPQPAAPAAPISTPRAAAPRAPPAGGPAPRAAARTSPPAAPRPSPVPEAPPPLAGLEDEITGGEPILVTELAPAGTGSEGLSAEEEAVLAALDRLAEGAPPEREVVKPAQAVAALIRLLLRKGVILERELLDELSRK